MPKTYTEKEVKKLLALERKKMVEKLEGMKKEVNNFPLPAWEKLADKRCNRVLDKAIKEINQP